MFDELVGPADAHDRCRDAAIAKQFQHRRTVATHERVIFEGDDHVSGSAPNVEIVAVNTMVKHALGQSAYKDRVLECAAAVEAIRARYPRVESLRLMMGRMPASPPEPAPAADAPPPVNESAPALAEASEPEARA